MLSLQRYVGRSKRPYPDAVFFVSLLALTACGSDSREFRLVTPVSPIDREIVEELTGLLDGEDGAHIRLTADALAEEAALDAVADGEADLAIVSNILPFRKDVASILPLYPTVLHVVRRASGEIDSGEEILRNARVFAGREGSASRYMFTKIYENLGLTEDDFSYVASVTDDPDVVIVFAPITPDRVAGYPGYTLVSMGKVSEVGGGGIVDRLVLLNPRFRPFVIPAGTYGVATPEPVATVAVDRLLVTRPGLDSTAVYDLIDEILRLRPAIAARRPGIFDRLDEDFDTSRSTFIVHAGAQAYLQRSEPSIYERYSGVAEVAVTLIVALSSALFAGAKVLKRRRKNRIDTFYSRTLAIGKSISDESGPDDRRRAIAAVRDLQTEAFELLVDERLAADESFRIFITLSNDVLRRLGVDDGERRPADA